MANLGNKTVDYRVYDRTGGKATLVGDITNYKRPTIANLTETMKGAGILGEIEIPTYAQLASMDIEFSYKRNNKEIISLFSQSGKEIEVRSVVDVLDTTTGKTHTESHKEIIRVLPKELGLGQAETNTTTDGSAKFTVVYYNYIIDGVSVIEIDKLNGVCKIMGTDYAAVYKEAL